MGFVFWWADDQRLIFSFSIGLLVMGLADVPLFPPQHKALKHSGKFNAYHETLPTRKFEK